MAPRSTPFRHRRACGLRRQHAHWHGSQNRMLPPPAQHIESVDVRKHHIEENDVGKLSLRRATIVSRSTAMVTRDAPGMCAADGRAGRRPAVWKPSLPPGGCGNRLSQNADVIAVLFHETARLVGFCFGDRHHFGRDLEWKIGLERSGSVSSTRAGSTKRRPRSLFSTRTASSRCKPGALRTIWATVCRPSMSTSNLNSSSDGGALLAQLRNAATGEYLDVFIADNACSVGFHISPERNTILPRSR